MDEDIVSAKRSIQRFRAMVNTTWEAWLSQAPKHGPEFNSLDDAFANAVDKITDAYEKLLDLMASPQLPEAGRARLASESIVEGAAAETATVLQRVASWYLRRISQQYDKWVIRLFLPTEDIYEAHQELQKSFDDAVKEHEANCYEPAASRYDEVVRRATDLLTKTKTRSVRHPQRRLFFLSVLISAILFSISIGVSLYLKLWR